MYLMPHENDKPQAWHGLKAMMAKDRVTIFKFNKD